MNKFLNPKAVGIAATIVLLAGNVFAQVGSDNPTGTSGQFNGNVTTACSYDPYTSNATRSITDLAVAGGVSSYPLAFTRTMNSRYTAGVSTPFGQAGNWNHSYGWSIDSATVVKTGGVGLPASYNVNYPDGRRILFSNTGTGDTYFRAPLGVRDRFIQLASGGTDCYVLLPDAGKVHFQANVQTTVNGSGSSATYTSVYRFTLVGIIDPYGQTTTVTYPSNTTLITEPAGRTIQISYTTGPAGDRVVDYITGSDGRAVHYQYQGINENGTTYSALVGVVYFGDSTYNASYSYQADNISSTGRPLIASCTDPMYDGPMWKISYNFQLSGTNADGSSVVSGQILREKHPNGTAVSTLTVNVKTSQGSPSRTETRGDNPTGGSNPSRTFTYNGYKLATSTDFKNVIASQTYDSNGYLASATDRNSNTITYVCKPYTGMIKSISYNTGGDVSGAGSTITLSYTYDNSTNAYYEASTPDGNSYTRDSNEQVTKITHADSNYETFSYNSFGEVLAHMTVRGFNESYVYDGSGRVTAYFDAAHPTSGNPTVWYQYDSMGRVSGITEARGTGPGDSNYTTTSQYNARGQLTRLTHPDGTYIQYTYNPNGTLAWTADERHPGATSDSTQRTSYTYDDYKRLRTVTTPVRTSGDNTPRVTTYYYDLNGTGDDYTRTAAVPTKIVSPGGKAVATTYDQNLRAVSATAVGDSNVPSAVTSYTYDGNGNVLTVKDPNGQATGAVTTYYYDFRNCVYAIDDPLSSDRNSVGHTRTFTYDGGGNVLLDRRADDLTNAYEYDSMGRVTKKTDYAGNVTTYAYDAAGNLTQMTEPGSHNYNYTYDPLDRKASANYPQDFTNTRRTESYVYDIANHLTQYTNSAGQVKTLTYDNRGRLTDTSWNSNGPSVHISYDATRPNGITTSDGTTLTFGYDEANNRTYEEQTNSGLPTRRVQTDPDADGNRADLLVKTGSTVNFATYFDYTSRSELLNIYDSSHAAFFKYSYDASGNVTQRNGQRLHDSTAMQFDALNRPIVSTQNGLNGTNFATSHYDYDKLGNLQDTYRDEESGKGERFGYDALKQLNSAVYSATNVTTTSPQNPTKGVTYDCSARNRKSMSVTDYVLNTTTSTAYTADYLNQYTSISINGGTGLPLSYDNNFNLTSYNGWTYTYDAENRLISVSGNGHTASFVYDALGRCVKRVLDSATTIFTYDQWTPVAEWDASGNLVATNVYGHGNDEIVYRSSGSNQLYYKSDPMGNVRFVLNANGTLVEKYVYDAFGAATITQLNGSAPTGNRFMYGGREYFTNLGLYDMRNRVYDPAIGRFYQTDPIEFEGDPMNLYRFSGYNPLLGGDPSGLDGFLGIDWSGVGASIIGTLSDFSNWLSSQSNQSGASSGSSGSDNTSDNPLGFTDQGPTDSSAGNYPWGYTGTSGTFAGGGSFSSGNSIFAQMFLATAPAPPSPDRAEKKFSFSPYPSADKQTVYWVPFMRVNEFSWRVRYADGSPLQNNKSTSFGSRSSTWTNVEREMPYNTTRVNLRNGNITSDGRFTDMVGDPIHQILDRNGKWIDQPFQQNDCQISYIRNMVFHDGKYQGDADRFMQCVWVVKGKLIIKEYTYWP